MNYFKASKIFLDGATAAEQLRSARQAKKLTLEQAASKLKINYKYLKALEKGQYQELPAGVYGKNFLREYAVFLGLNYHELAQVYTSEKNLYDGSAPVELFSKQVVSGRYFWAMPKLVKNLLIAVVIAFCFIYFGFRLNKIMSPPALTVINPAGNMVIRDHAINISGKIEAEARLMINGEMVLSDASGNFAKTVRLKDGVNVVSITASKKYGRDQTIVRQILVKND